MSDLGHVTLTRVQLQRAEERMEGEQASCVVSRARVVQTHREFWQRIEQRAASAHPRAN